MRAIARGLRDRGLTAGDTVAVVMPNTRELLEIYGAAVQIGLTFVAPNWHLGVDELAYIFEDSNARLVVAHERFADAARDAAERAGVAAPVRVEELADEPVSGPADEPLEDRQAGQIMFYTSGTTGRPPPGNASLPGFGGARMRGQIGVSQIDPHREVQEAPTDLPWIHRDALVIPGRRARTIAGIVKTPVARIEDGITDAEDRSAARQHEHHARPSHPTMVSSDC
jgi:hypothetical protein